jgi:hypothetical protein
MSGNTPWAAQYAAELREIVTRYAERAPRNVQRHLGPSEIGHVCDRQVAGKLAGLPRTNHVTDPWASIMGVAGHAWMEGCLSWANGDGPRFLTEFRVTPSIEGLRVFEGHPGTGDGYDHKHRAVIDHKFLGKTTMAKLQRQGPPRHYWVQFLLYWLGFLALGLPVERIALLAWPRTSSTIADLYVWEHEVGEAQIAYLRDDIAPELARRKQWAAALLTGTAQLSDVPMDAADECKWRPFSPPQSARDGGPGCPGHAGQQ